MAGAGEVGLNPAAAAAAGVAARALHWRPPRIAAALAAAALALHGLLFGTAAPWGTAPAAGLAAVGLGLGWMLWAWARLRAAATPLRPTQTPRRLVDEGPFAFGRNPMYLGIALALLGLGAALGVPLLAAAAAGFIAVVARVHVPHEEAALRHAFGGWYSDYAAQVRRWL